MESLAKLDTKGRILIPSRMRKKMCITPDTELVLMPERDWKGIRMMPISNKDAAKCTVLLSNSPADLSSVMEVLSTLNVEVVMSESKNYLGNGTSEWTFILDTRQSREGLPSLEERLASLECVKSVNLLTK